MENKTDRFLKLLGGSLALLVIALSLWLRLSGIGFGLPFGDYADEAGIPVTAARIMTDGDWNPHYFAYPPLTAYTITVVTSSIRWGDSLMGNKLSGMTDQHLAHWTGRIISATYGTGLVILVLLLGTFMWSFPAGLAAATLASIHPTFLLHSHLSSVDMALLFWIVSTGLMIFCYLHTGSHRFIIVGAFTIGIATAVKYNGLFLLAPLCLAVLYSRFDKDSPFSGFRSIVAWCVLLCMISVGFFLVLAPYTVLDFDSFKDGVLLEMHHQKVGHYGLNQGSSTTVSVPLFWGFREHLSILYSRCGLPVLLCFLASLVLIAWFKLWHHLIFLSIPALYFLFMGFSRNAPERYTMIIFPFVFIMAAGIVDRVTRKLPVRSLVTVVLTLCLTVPWLGDSKLLLTVLNEPQTVQQARDWFFKHIPPDYGIAADIYTGVWIRGGQFNQQKLPSLAHRSPEWYTHHDISFLVSSSLIRERDMERGSSESWRLQFYSWLDRECLHVKRFSGTRYDLFNPDVDIYLRRSDRKMFHQGESVDFTVRLEEKPPRRVTVVVENEPVFNGKMQNIAISQTVHSTQKSILGFILFKGAVSETFKPLSWEISGLEEQSGWHVSSQNKVAGPNLPGIFYLTKTVSLQ